MGRYFNDDMTEDQNDDYDAYLEHYGVPKIKWSAEARSRFDSQHHKTKEDYRSLSDFDSKKRNAVRSAQARHEQAKGTEKKRVYANRISKRNDSTTADHEMLKGIKSAYDKGSKSTTVKLSNTHEVQYAKKGNKFGVKKVDSWIDRDGLKTTGWGYDDSGKNKNSNSYAESQYVKNLTSKKPKKKKR